MVSSSWLCPHWYQIDKCFHYNKSIIKMYKLLMTWNARLNFQCLLLKYNNLKELVYDFNYIMSQKDETIETENGPVVKDHKMKN